MHHYRKPYICVCFSYNCIFFYFNKLKTQLLNMYRIVTMPLRTNTIKILCQQSYSYHTIPSLRFTRYLAHPHAAPTPLHTPTRHAHPPDPPYPHTHTPHVSTVLCAYTFKDFGSRYKRRPRYLLFGSVALGLVSQRAQTNFNFKYYTNLIGVRFLLLNINYF